MCIINFRFNRITVTATAYPITVGAGGAQLQLQVPSHSFWTNPGSNSVFSTITSAGGGGGGTGRWTSSVPYPNSVRTPQPWRFRWWRFSKRHYWSNGGGSGNTPPVSPPQGNPWWYKCKSYIHQIMVLVEVVVQELQVVMVLIQILGAWTWWYPGGLM